jgi:hypothetical protein
LVFVSFWFFLFFFKIFFVLLVFTYNVFSGHNSLWKVLWSWSGSSTCFGCSLWSFLRSTGLFGLHRPLQNLLTLLRQ